MPDPFYVDRAAFVTIPRDWLAKFLVRCSRHGIRVLIDLHAFPGGSSQGTYNGVSRQKMRFKHIQTVYMFVMICILTQILVYLFLLELKLG